MNKAITTSVAGESIITQAFTWMFAGLTLTGITAYVVASNQALANLIFTNPLLFYGIIIGELALVLFLSFRILKMSFATAVISFVTYAFLNGLTLSAIFFVYTSTSIYTIFFITAALFGIMAFYGYTTKTDLTSIGNLALMLLLGIILATVVNIFLNNAALQFILSYLTVGVFVGLTAYDTQKLKKLSEQTSNQNLGVLGALTLYLDFINIFLSLLRLLGKRR